MKIRSLSDCRALRQQARKMATQRKSVGIIRQEGVDYELEHSPDNLHRLINGNLAQFNDRNIAS